MDSGRDAPLSEDGETISSAARRLRIFTLRGEEAASEFSGTTASDLDSEESLDMAFSATTEVQAPDLREHIDASIERLTTSLEVISQQLVDMQALQSLQFAINNDTFGQMTESLERLDQRMKALERQWMFAAIADLTENRGNPLIDKRTYNVVRERLFTLFTAMGRGNAMDLGALMLMIIISIGLIQGPIRTFGLVSFWSMQTVQRLRCAQVCWKMALELLGPDYLNLQWREWVFRISSDTGELL